MAARLTDKQIKKILADYAELGTYNAAAKANGVCNHTVKRIVGNCPEISKNIQIKKEENTADILAYMERKRSIVCEILSKGLDALNSPEKFAEASPAQITTAMGTLIDKWASIGGGIGDQAEEDALSKSLRELAGGLESDAE